MNKKLEEFINCAMFAFEEGKNAQEIEDECSCGKGYSQTQGEEDKSNNKSKE